MRPLGLLLLLVVPSVQAAAKPDAGTPPPTKPAAKVATKDAGVPTKDAGVPTKDAGVPTKDAGAPAKDTGAAKDAGTPAKASPTSDAGAHAEAPKDAAKTEPAYAIKAVPAPDKATERLWKSKCGACHGVDGKAQTEKGKKMHMADFTAAPWQTGHSNDELKKAISDGQKFTRDGVLHEMDAFSAEVTPAQVDALLGYVRWVGAPH